MRLAASARDRRVRNGFTLIELLIVLAVIAVVILAFGRGCSPSKSSSPTAQKSNTERTLEVSGGIEYEPPVVPITITLTRRGISASVKGRVLTPFGRFSAFSEASFPKKKTLTIVLGKHATVYELNNRKRYTILLPNDLKGRTKIHTDGDGNIKVVVPQPVLKRGAE